MKIPLFGSPDRIDSLRPEGDVALATEGGRLDMPERGLRGLILNKLEQMTHQTLVESDGLTFRAPFA